MTENERLSRHIAAPETLELIKQYGEELGFLDYMIESLSGDESPKSFDLAYISFCERLIKTPSKVKIQGQSFSELDLPTQYMLRTEVNNRVLTKAKFRDWIPHLRFPEVRDRIWDRTKAYYEDRMALDYHLQVTDIDASALHDIHNEQKGLRYAPYYAIMKGLAVSLLEEFLESRMPPLAA